MSIRNFTASRNLKKPVLKKKNSAVPIAAHLSTKGIPNVNIADQDFKKNKKKGGFYPPFFAPLYNVLLNPPRQS